MLENHYPGKEVGQAFQPDLQCLSLVRGNGVINEAGCWDYLVGMTLGAIHVSQVPESGWPGPVRSLPAQALPAMRFVFLQSAIQNPKSRIQNHVSALRRSQLGHRHGRAIGAGMDDSSSWKTEETIIRLAKVACILQIWWLSPFTFPERRFSPAGAA